MHHAAYICLLFPCFEVQAGWLVHLWPYSDTFTGRGSVNSGAPASQSFVFELGQAKSNQLTHTN